MTDKMLADATEALMGAIAKDANHEMLRKIILKLWGEHLKKEMTALIVAQSKPVEIKQQVASESVLASSSSVELPLSPRTQRHFESLFSPTVPLVKLDEIMKKSPHIINRQNNGKKGDTPLISLLRNEKVSLDRVQLLAARGALWSAPNKKGETAEKILKEKHPEMVKSFLK